MSTSMMVRFAGWTLLVGVLFVQSASSMAQHGTRPHISKFPAACYFFVPSKVDHSTFDKDQSAKNRTYQASVAGVYRLWCTPVASTPEMKNKAADDMATAWKTLWNEDNPYNATFHETGAFDLLVLMGITHQLPAPMATDPKLTQTWIDACNNSCFTIFGDPAKLGDQRNILMQLGLRNDVLRDLRNEPASESVVQMLQDAQFRLVD
jgi:hypothetical protein